MSDERVNDNNSGIPDTRVSGGAEIEGQKIGFNVANPDRPKCPDGSYWVKSYYKGTYPFGFEVQGHCRKAGATEEMQEQVLDARLKEQQQKENFRMQEREARLREKEKRHERKLGEDDRQ